MKKLLTLTLFVVFALQFNTVSAQKTKIGHVYIDSVVMLMPQLDSLETIVLKLRNQYQMESRIKQAEYDGWYSSIAPFLDSLSPEQMQAAQMRAQQFEQELANIDKLFQDRINKQYGAFNDMVVTEILEMIEVIAKEQGYTYVINASESATTVLFASETHDLTDEVFKRLGVDKQARIDILEKKEAERKAREAAQQNGLQPGGSMFPQ